MDVGTFFTSACWQKIVILIIVYNKLRKLSSRIEAQTHVAAAHLITPVTLTSNLLTFGVRINTCRRPNMEYISQSSLVVIAQAPFLLQRGHTHMVTVTDATEHATMLRHEGN